MVFTNVVNKIEKGTKKYVMHTTLEHNINDSTFSVAVWYMRQHSLVGHLQEQCYDDQCKQ